MLKSLIATLAVTTSLVAEQPNALDNYAAIIERMADKQPMLFLDFDGNLSPITPSPYDAELPEETRGLLVLLNDVTPLAIVTGRAITDVKARVQLPQLVYSGNHGYEVEGPWGYRCHGADFIDAIDQAYTIIEEAVSDFEGIDLEHKRLTLSVHTKQCSQEHDDAVVALMHQLVEQFPGLTYFPDHRLHELWPPHHVNKGTATTWIMELMEIDPDSVFPIFMGDGQTDEAGFAAVQPQGIGIKISQGDKATCAEYSLADTIEVRLFLQRIYENLTTKH